jgi:hypothetical protein
MREQRTEIEKRAMRIRRHLHDRLVGPANTLIGVEPMLKIISAYGGLSYVRPPSRSASQSAIRGRTT